MAGVVLSVPGVVLRRARAAVLCLGAVLLALGWLHEATGLGGQAGKVLFRGWVFVAIQACAAVACLLTAGLARAPRLSSALLGTGLLCSAIGSTIMTLAPGSDLPVPSVADPLWLAVYPCQYAALLVLTQRRIGKTLLATRLDGVLSGLAAAAALGTVTIPVALSGAAGEGFWTAAVFVAYPVGDLVLLGAVVSAVALAGWRLDRTWALLAGAIIIWETADLLYLLGPENLMSFADELVLTGTLGFAVALATRLRPVAPHSRDRGLFVPIGFGLLALAILGLAAPLNLHPVSILLAAAAMALVLARMAMALRENRTLLVASQEEATTDALTGLRNRRAMKLDLAHVLADGHGSEPHVLILLDLNGFKAYNDAYGHNAGDDLLARLGAALTRAVTGSGTAYRMGGDEFCVLAPASDDVDEFAQRCAEALVERGSAFFISAAYGVVRLPEESSDPHGAVALADARMYQNKNSLRLPAAHQSAEVLVALLHEQAPSLVERMRAVRDTACAIGAELGLDGEDAEALRHAAALHDVGMIAIPSTIVDKPGPLSDAEWQLVRRHPVIAERILSAAPALASSARLVRWTHERVDGTGYPDGLAGQQIPIAARIISVAAAFHAMTAGRPYAAARPPGEALDELRRCAGTQFDPAVVQALERTAVTGTRRA
jgi:diguanylate cyclase (GGDEF)-like protein